MTALRSLAPSNQLGDSSSSSPTKGLQSESSSTQATSGSGEAGGAGGGSGSGGGSGAGGEGSRKRRAAGTVSTNACNSCKQARQKCEGNKPDPCKRCRDRRLHCVYEPHTKTAKDDLLRSLEDTRAKNTELQNRNKDIAVHAKGLEEANRDLKQTSDSQRIILETIGSNGHDREIIKKIRGGESHQAIADWLVAENPDYQSFALEPATHRTLTEVVKIYEAQCQQYDGLPRVGGPSESRIPWTKVSADHKLLGHLFDLYFTWVHPVHMLLSEPDFKHDFKHNNGTHCSSSLVNVICAMACLLLEGEKEASKFTDLRRELNAAALRDGFMEEAKKALAEQPFESLTSIQTLAVMYLVDLSAGKSRSATGYLRSASEGLRAKKGYQQTKEAIEVTIWGIRNLIISCVGTTYQKLYVSADPSEVVFQHVQIDGDANIWRYYRSPGDERDMPTRPSHAIMSAGYQSLLFQVVSDTIRLYCGLEGTITAGAIIDLYRRFLLWKEDLPPALKTASGMNEEALPHVIYLHIQFQTALVQLLIPLAESDKFTGSNLREIRNFIRHHAHQGLEYFQYSNRLYTSRFQMPLLSFCCVHLADAHIYYTLEDSPGPGAAELCLGTLQQNREGFAICGPLQELFRRRAIERGVQLPEGIRPIVESVAHFGIDDFLDACTRLSYTQPLDQVQIHFDENIAHEWDVAWNQSSGYQPGNSRRPSSSGGSGGSGRMAIEDIINRDV